jgi:hypothetical protein
MAAAYPEIRVRDIVVLGSLRSSHPARMATLTHMEGLVRFYAHCESHTVPLRMLLLDPHPLMALWLDRTLQVGVGRAL